MLVFGSLIIGACSSPPDQSGASSGGEDSLEHRPSATGEADTTGTPASFTEAQWRKLDHALQLLFRQGPGNPFFSYQVREREAGQKTYGVLLRTSDPKALSETDLPLGTPSSKIVTARLTLEEIRRATQLEAVVSISNPAEARPN